MRYRHLMLAAVLLACSTALPAQVLESEHSARLQTWLNAVDLHQPGRLDLPLTVVASWSTDDIEDLLPAMLAYIDALRQKALGVPNGAGPNGAGTAAAAGTCVPCELSQRERTRLLAATQRRLSAADKRRIADLPARSLNALLIRAAVLHMDAVLYAPPAVAASTPRRSAPYVLGSPETQLRVNDGEFAGRRSSTASWYLGRALLQFVVPEPAGDEATRLWYGAATAYLGLQRDYGQLRPHLNMAQWLYPGDAGVALLAGWQFETHASDRVQQEVRALLADANNDQIKADSLGIRGVRDSLADAERYLRFALDRNPALAEAAIRLANVLHQQGRDAEALPLVAALPTSTGDTVLDYFGNMARGVSAEALGKLDDAEVAYTKARALFPRAQSAHLALSALAGRQNNHYMALAHLRDGIAAGGSQADDDPYDRYASGPGRALFPLLDVLYARIPATTAAP